MTGSDERRRERGDGSQWGVGIALGVAFGVAVGVALGNIGAGVAIGIALGIAFAGAFAEAARRRGTASAGDAAAEPPDPNARGAEGTERDGGDPARSDDAGDPSADGGADRR